MVSPAAAMQSSMPSGNCGVRVIWALGWTLIQKGGAYCLRRSRVPITIVGALVGAHHGGMCIGIYIYVYIYISYLEYAILVLYVLVGRSACMLACFFVSLLVC